MYTLLTLSLVLVALPFGKANSFNVIDCLNGSWHILETLPPDLNLLLVGSNSTFAGWMRMLVGDGASYTHRHNSQQRGRSHGSPSSYQPQSVTMAALWGELLVPLKEQSQPDTWRGPVLNQTITKLAIGKGGGTRFNLVTNDCRPAGAFFHYACVEVQAWEAMGVADVTWANFSQLVSTPALPAQGFLHAKVIATESHGYSGSANLAYTSLSQTKELGLMFLSCPAVAQVFAQASAIWTYAGAKNAVPPEWPLELQPQYGPENPLNVNVRNANGAPESMQLYPCYSPPPLQYAGQAADCADVLLRHIADANEFIAIQAMQFAPVTLYQHYAGLPELYWGAIDSALREAAFRGVKIRLVFSNWTMTTKNFPQQQPYWRSLNQIANIDLRQFRMPALHINSNPPVDIPALARVNHNKFFLSEKVAYISTSNLTPDYFKFFAGFDWTVVNDGANTLHATLLKVFERDWNSPYVVPLFDAQDPVPD